MRKIGVHPLVKVRFLGEEVGDLVQGARDVLKSIIEILEELDPLGLVACDFLQFMEILKVFMICADADRVFRAQKERSTALKAKNNAE
jgi:hypothetical protein